MPINPLILSSAISAGSNLLGRLFGGTPKGPDIEGIRTMINQEFDRQLASQLAGIARQTRAQLTAAGQSGSGTINQAILDNQNRLRESIEQRRSQALRQLEQFKLSGDLQQANLGAQNTQDFFSGLGGLGANAVLLNDVRNQNLQQQQAFQELMERSNFQNIQMPTFGNYDTSAPTDYNTPQTGNSFYSLVG